MTYSGRMPVLFIGHGSPMNAIDNNEFSEAWAQIARQIPRPDAVLCISAHWESRGGAVTSGKQPDTIHDFYGFPDELFAVRYPAPGSPELAAAVAKLTQDVVISQNSERGLDHGAWRVLRRMYPAADIPVVQLSLDSSPPGRFHYELGRKLRSLREKNVLVLGSGNIVHNLRLYDFYDQTPYVWARAFDDSVVKLVTQGDYDALANFEELPDARLAIPTPEHYLPLLYILGMCDADERPRIFCRRTLKSLAMTSFAFGLA